MHQSERQLVQRLIERFRQHSGRGGCGVGAIADLTGTTSHDLIEWALSGLCQLEHRGGAIDETGDGAGLLISTDQSYFSRFIASGKRLPDGHHLSVGVLFFPMGEKGNLPHWQQAVDATLRRHGLMPLGWRHVPVNEFALGCQALDSRRDVWQVLIGEGMVALTDLPLTFQRVKVELEHQIRDLYVASLSPRTLVYKAMATGNQLARFYPDLTDPQLSAGMVVFHRRYSTNTYSNWYLAQVFRTLCHNGEINTIKANRNAVLNLEAELGLDHILMPQGSDSADFDRVVDLFVSHGITLPETLSRLMPMAWQDVPDLAEGEVKYFQAIQRAMGTLGAWEGPAAIVASDGEYLVAALDRMGLRPLRYLMTQSGRLVIGSEIGAIPVPFGDIRETGQLDAGEMLALHLPTRQLYRPREVLTQVVAHTPINLDDLNEQKLIVLARGSMATGEEAAKPEQNALNLFGWSLERCRNVRYMAENGKEAITSMGYDRPLPAFSAMRPPLTKYFKQIVAVVTNPPIDPIREGGAFDLTVHLGTSPEVHEHRQVYQPLPQYKLDSPFLSEAQFAAIRDAAGDDLPGVMVLDATFDDPAQGTQAGAKAIARRINDLCRDGVAQVRAGKASIVIVSDRRALETECLPLPMVLVTSALHNALVEAGLRRHAGIVVETGEVQEGHDAAVMIANGATALYPYLYYQVGLPHGPVDKLINAMDEALKRIMSKMGICSVDGYRGSRLFEAVAIAPEVVDHYLPGITSRIGGIELGDIYGDIAARKALGNAVARDTSLAIYRKEVWTELQTTARGHDPESYQRFVRLIEATPPIYLRDLMQLRKRTEPLELDEVATEEAIIAHTFRGAAMSHGALHRIAHRAIAAAFNDYGALSNCGEGGEDPRRDQGAIWENSRSRIRQVASGRFGVDARYLIHADELSIKIGQGAKPGEGGMLPAAKVTAEVAYIRKTQEGVALISPPPHHDIYSIEDLAQLIYNLRQVNPKARVSVKIPAVTDIGTIAVGIAKAGADIIDVSGFEGGTGAAASSSIEHAGLPLERALSETHQALVINGIRHLVKLRADGGIKTGFDVAVILALGADEVSLGTALMVAEQCIFCHGCANGMCPAGITTQNELVARRLMTEKKGRAKDDELPDDEAARFEDARNGVKRYLWALAHDLRQQLAEMGLRHPKQLVGRVDLLQRKEIDLPRHAKVDLSEILLDPKEGGERVTRVGTGPLSLDPTSALNARILDDVRQGLPLHYPVSSTDRAIGATLAGQIALGAVPVPANGYTISLTGYAGQALGFAAVDGMLIRLEGIANDQVAAAMGGGTVVIRRPIDLKGDQSLSLAGNAVAYGATGGRLFVEGRVGQRVGVRNSGAVIVVEGAGKYAFEYMTGGIGVVLGPIGPVVGSGMTGGVLYLWDAGKLAQYLHTDVLACGLEADDEARLKDLLTAHFELTQSKRAMALLMDWENQQGHFVKVLPKPTAVPASASAPVLASGAPDGGSLK